MSDCMHVSTQPDVTTAQGMDHQEIEQTGSRILAQVVKRMNLEREATTSWAQTTWAQNWNAHGNHNNHSNNRGK